MDWLTLWRGLAMITFVPLLIGCSTSSECTVKQRVKQRDLELCVVATGEDRVMIAVLNKNTLNSLEITPEQACCYLRYLLSDFGEQIADVVAGTIVGDTSGNSAVVPRAMDKLSTKELKAGAEMVMKGVRVDFYSLDRDGHIQERTDSKVLKFSRTDAKMEESKDGNHP